MKAKYSVMIFLMTALNCLGQSDTEQIATDSNPLNKVVLYECNYFKEALYASIRAKTVTYDYLLPNEYTVIHTACLCEDVELIRLLSEFKIDINLKDKAGNTPLMYACSRGNKEIIELLISQGAKVNVKNKNNDTPLMLLSGNDNDLLSKLLVKKGAKIFEKNKNGSTAILNAISRFNNDLFDFYFDKYIEKKIYNP